MIDLHCHMLPGIDDGAPNLATALEMARIAVADGITHTACTPHIYPGLYENNAAGIEKAVQSLRGHLREANIPLQITTGSDAHLVPELLSGLQSGRVATLHKTRYFLLEPSHHVAPPRFRDTVFEIMVAGYHPVITHPERLTWVGDHYDDFVYLARQGVWMQITAGALTGKFGKAAQNWGERFLEDGITHIIASDAHTTGRRAPIMSQARQVAERRLGEAEAQMLVCTRPEAILRNLAPKTVAPPPGLIDTEKDAKEVTSGKSRLLSWFTRR
jgi:protein-tyrosine phosphatase